MVDESLIAYLENSLGGDELNDDEKSLLESKLRHLLAYNNEPHRFSAGEAEQIISAIDKVKVLDIIAPKLIQFNVSKSRCA